MQFSVPYPPSTNKLWRNVGGKTLKSSAYRAWLAEALVLLRGQRVGKHRGSFRATIVVDRPDLRRRDLDNLVKSTMDLLKDAEVIEDDSLAQSITLAWAWEKVTPGGAMLVGIEPSEFPIFLMGRAA